MGEGRPTGLQVGREPGGEEPRPEPPPAQRAEARPRLKPASRSEAPPRTEHRLTRRFSADWQPIPPVLSRPAFSLSIH